MAVPKNSPMNHFGIAFIDYVNLSPSDASPSWITTVRYCSSANRPSRAGWEWLSRSSVPLAATTDGGSILDRSIACLAVFLKELRALLFSCADGEVAGIRVTVVWSGFLILTAATLTVNFQTVGGLMIYSPISNPAAGAFQVIRGCKHVLLLSTGFGAVSGLGGFLIAAATDLPSGAVIVLVSSAILVLAALARGSVWIPRA